MKEFIEKLIGRLEEELESTREIQTIECKGNNGYGTPLQAKLSGEICALLKVKNIVNELAEEYNNDFCEWEYISSVSHYANIGCKNVERNIKSMRYYTYCPYCGKKIKVIGKEGE